MKLKIKQSAQSHLTSYEIKGDVKVISVGVEGEKFSKRGLDDVVVLIDLVTVFYAILTSKQTREKLQCLYENLMSKNFRRTAVQKKKMICKLKRYS